MVSTHVHDADVIAHDEQDIRLFAFRSGCATKNKKTN
jgi:hypothetical protein